MYSSQGNDLSNLNYSFDLLRMSNDASERSIVFYSILFAFNEAGYTFFQFRVIHFLFFSFATLLLTSKLTKDSTYVIACCALFPILTFGSQMRNGLGVTLLYLGLFFLMTIKKRSIKFFLYFICIIAATTIHYIFIVYLLAIVPFINWNRNVLLKHSILLMLVLFVLVFAGRLSGLVGFMGDWYSRYTQGTDFRIRLQIPLIILIGINTFFTWICESYVTKSSLFSSNDKDIVKYVSRLNIVFLSLLPLLFLSGSFFRIYQNITILSVISIAITASRYYVNGKSEGANLRVVYFAFYMFYSVFYIHWQGEFLALMRSISL